MLDHGLSVIAMLTVLVIAAVAFAAACRLVSVIGAARAGGGEVYVFSADPILRDGELRQ
jgi:hypothetical protein